MDIAIAILQKERGGVGTKKKKQLFAASVKGNPGKTSKLGSFKQTNDCTRAQSYLYANHVCLVTSILFMDGLTEFSDVFCQIMFPTLVLLCCFKVQTEICLSS